MSLKKAVRVITRQSRTSLLSAFHDTPSIPKIVDFATMRKELDRKEAEGSDMQIPREEMGFFLFIGPFLSTLAGQLSSPEQQWIENVSHFCSWPRTHSSLVAQSILSLPNGSIILKV